MSLRRGAVRPFHPDHPRSFYTLNPPGQLGTLRTVGIMGKLIRAGSSDPLVAQKARQIFAETGVRPNDYLGEVNALYQWVRDNIRYTRDIYGVELLHTAQRVLNDLAGDCDDFSILLGALLEATGHPVRIVIVGYHADRPDLYTHVFLETLVQDRWIPMDSTLPVPLGVTARYAHRRIIHLPRAKRFARGTKSAA